MALNVYTAPVSPYPHEEFDISILLIIEEGLRKAWEILRTVAIPGFNLKKATEDHITRRLSEIISNEVLKKNLVPGFTLDQFRVRREAKYCNFNGEHPDKEPDLVIDYLPRAHNVARISEDGLFIECKPVGKAHPVGSTYCDKGLQRFIIGDYAWTMPQAMMVGYASKGYTIVPKLQKALIDRSNPKCSQRIDTLQHPSPCIDPLSATKSWCEAVYITTHSRPFPFEGTNEIAPPITLRHLWLKRD